MMKQKTFKVGDRVRVSHAYPIDREYPIPHGDDADMWGLLGTVVASEFGYIDTKYVFVEPLTSIFLSDWPRKQKFDPLSYWHFTPDELEHN